MLASLAESRRRQQRLVEDAGHELRTPLTSLRTNLDVLRRHPDLDVETRAQVLDDLDRDTTELAGLVEEVVAVAADRHDDGPPQTVMLGPLVERVGARMARRTGRQVIVSTDDSVVVARPAALERAVANLVDNAGKFSPDDTPVEVRVVDGAVTVADRGPGIPTGELESVFDRFHRTAEARGLPGSGLGLAIVAAVAADGGGSAVARNREGGGAEVTLALPAVPPGTLT
jgi:two-component system sensor histidine kinase MprB